MTHPNIPALMVDLVEAAAATRGERPCQVCEYIGSLEAGPTRDALTDAAAGTIGIKKLEAIFVKHEIPVGRRAIIRHRKEEHVL